MTTQVAGYTYGTNDVARSPLTLEDLKLKQTVLFTDDEISPKSWRSVGRPNWCDSGYVVFLCWFSPHLAQYFSTPDNQLMTYLATVRKRFYQWILDTCNRSYDQTLDYQQEIGLRHTYAKKSNRPCCLCAAYTAIHDCLHHFCYNQALLG